MKILELIFNWINRDSIKKELNNQKIKNISDQLESKGEDAIDECAICTDELVGHFITVLPCDTRHIFHTKCINLWLDKNTTCPLCKKNIKKEYNDEAKIKSNSTQSIINNIPYNETQSYPAQSNVVSNSNGTTVILQQQMLTYYNNCKGRHEMRETYHQKSMNSAVKWELYSDQDKEIKLMETFNIGFDSLIKINNSYYKSQDMLIEYKFYADGNWQRSYL